MSVHGDQAHWRERALEAERDILRAELAERDALVLQLRRDLAQARLELVRRARGLILCGDEGPPVLDKWIEGPGRP